VRAQEYIAYGLFDLVSSAAGLLSLCLATLRLLFPTTAPTPRYFRPRAWRDAGVCPTALCPARRDDDELRIPINAKG
jgi:hypothetical protein